MTSPLKPWEKPGIDQQQVSHPLANSANSGIPELQSLGDGGGGGISVSNPSVPPPVPPRNNSNSSGLGPGYINSGGLATGYGGYGSNLGSIFGNSGMYNTGMYGSSPYGGYGGYNRYGGFSGGFGDVPPNSFVRMAEENSRQAFQSIEGVVQAFGSVAMMLESTYSAVFNSFRAVIGVADHFSRMRTHFAQIFSALAVIKTLKWLYRRLLVLLRLRDGGMQEDVWANLSSQAVGSALVPGAKGKANWPIMLFFAVIIGGPYLIWKFLSSIGSKAGDGWMSGEDDHFVGQAQYDYRSQSNEEVSFKCDQKITIAPKELQPQVRGWLLASVDGQTVGLIPANYVKVLGKRRGTRTPRVLPLEQSSSNKGFTSLENNWKEKDLNTDDSKATSVLTDTHSIESTSHQSSSSKDKTDLYTSEKWDNSENS